MKKTGIALMSAVMMFMTGCGLLTATDEAYRNGVLVGIEAERTRVECGLPTCRFSDMDETRFKMNVKRRYRNFYGREEVEKLVDDYVGAAGFWNILDLPF